MLVNLTHTLTLATTQQDAWNLLRDTKRLAALIPSVESVTPVDVEKHVAEIRKFGCEVISDPGVVPVKFRAPGGTVAEIVPKARYKKS